MRIDLHSHSTASDGTQPSADVVRPATDTPRLAAVFTGQKPSGTRLFDTSSGTLLVIVPAGDELVGFSADGDEMLTKNYTDSGVTELRVYDDSGNRRLTRLPPQIVANNGMAALDAGGE